MQITLHLHACPIQRSGNPSRLLQQRTQPKHGLRVCLCVCVPAYSCQSCNMAPSPKPLRQPTRSILEHCSVSPCYGRCSKQGQNKCFPAYIAAGVRRRRLVGRVTCGSLPNRVILHVSDHSVTVKLAKKMNYKPLSAVDSYNFRDQVPPARRRVRSPSSLVSPQSPGADKRAMLK